MRWTIVPLMVGVVVSGTALGADRVDAQDRPVIRITHPPAGTPVTAHPVLVRGTIEPADPEVRLTANGRLAFLIQGGEWATLIDLPAGTHAIAVDARARGRLVSRAETRVTVAGPVPEAGPMFGPMVGWALSERGQVATIDSPPYELAFRLNNHRDVRAQVDPNGSGRAIHPLGPGQEYLHTYRGTGFVTPVLRYVDRAGQAFTQQMLIGLVDRTWLEPIIQAVWGRFWAAVERDDREEALSLIDFTKREEIRLVFEQFGPAELRKWAAMTGGGSITVNRVVSGQAYCTQKRGNDHSFDLIFVLDLTVGQWRYHLQ